MPRYCPHLGEPVPAPARRRGARAMSGLVALVTLALAVGVLVVGPAAAVAAGRGLALRYTLTGFVGVEQAGDVLLSCVPGSSAGGEPCTAAQAGGRIGNDGYAMAYVDTDQSAGTFDSSTAQLVAPPGATIAFAGLYWGGDAGSGNDAGTPGCRSAPSANRITPPPAPGRAGQVLVDVNGSGYRGVAATTLDTLPNSLGGATFQGYADVTRLFAKYSGVTSATPISVTVANAQLAQGYNCAGGWSVVLVYAYPAADPTWAPAYRSVHLLDGLATVAPGAPASATADGFRVATDGAPALAQAGVVLYDGDRDSPAAQLTVNGVEATDTIGDSTVAGSAYGVTVNAVGPVAPNLGNALGYDSRVVDLPDGAPAPGATSAAASIATTGHPVTVGALVLVERVDPLLAMARTVTRADGSDAAGADVVTGAKLRYTLQLAAYTPLTGVTVTDPVPAGLAAVDGSLTLNGAPVDPATGSLAGGRAAVTLPALDPATPVTIGYDVTVTPAAAAGVPLVSRASVGYAAGGVALTGYSPQVSVLANRVDLALTATASAPAVGLAQQSQVTVALTNAGAVPATGVTVAVPVPPGLALLAAVPDQGSFDAPSGAWTVGALAPGAGTTLKITVGPGQAPAPSASPVPSGTSTTPVTFAATVVAEVSGADQPDVDSLPGDGLTGEDDQAAVTLQVTALAGQVPASPASPDALPGAAGRGGFRVDDMLTAAGLMLGSALILIGAMVFVSARRRRRYS